MRLLLVEDDDHVATALSAVLARHGFEVGQARSGQEALQELLHSELAPFDVVLLDLGLPDQDGFEVCGRIRKLTGTPVIMVTARADVRSRIHGLNLGADDYVVKPYDTGELLARVHAVARRTAAADPETAAGAASGTGTGAVPVGAAGAGGAAERGADQPAAPLVVGPVTLEPNSRRVSVGGAEVQLTRKEFDLLALLAARPGVVFRREQIISEVWRSSWEGTGRTLEVHIASLRGKLGLPALIETVRGVGYRLVPPPAG